jgi:transposase-like protein
MHFEILDGIETIATGARVREIAGYASAMVVAACKLAEVAQRHGVRVAFVSSWQRQWARSGKGTAKLAKLAAVRVSAPSVEICIEIDLAGGCEQIRGQSLKFQLVRQMPGRSASSIVHMLREVLAATR